MMLCILNKETAHNYAIMHNARKARARWLTALPQGCAPGSAVESGAEDTAVRGNDSEVIYYGETSQGFQFY